MAPPTRTPRSSWLDEGLRALAAGGPDDDRQALLDDMVDTWERRTTDDVVARLEREGGDARAKIRRAGELTFSADDGLRDIDLAVRDWSRREPTVAERLRRVDNRRMDYLRSLFGTFCQDPDDIEVRCMLAFSLLIGNHFIAADHDGYSRAEVLALTLRRILL
jgi:hypothetical protein